MDPRLILDKLCLHECVNRVIKMPFSCALWSNFLSNTLNNNLIILLLYSKHMLDLKNIGGGGGILPINPILKSEVT
jgi:hypothetical protein